MDFIDTLSSEIISTYKKHSDREITRPDYLPEKDEISKIIKILRRIIFPGYFDENGASG